MPGLRIILDSSAPGSWNMLHSQYTRIEAVCPTVAQTGHRSGTGRTANSSADRVRMTSTIRWL